MKDYRDNYYWVVGSVLKDGRKGFVTIQHYYKDRLHHVKVLEYNHVGKRRELKRIGELLVEYLNKNHISFEKFDTQDKLMNS